MTSTPASDGVAEQLALYTALGTELAGLQALAAQHTHANQAALHAVQEEQRQVDAALTQLAANERQTQRDEQKVLAPSTPLVRYTAPLLPRTALSTMPVLAAHAAERRRTRALLSLPHWNAQDIDALTLAVENEHVRSDTLHTPVDWTRIAVHVPYHTAPDCRTRWHFFERPGVNSSRWTTAEKRALADSLRAMPQPYWEEAADALGTGRTGHAALETYQRGIKPEMAWTPERDAALLAAVHTLGPDWKAVVDALDLPSFCASLCHQRHNQLKNTAIRHGRWSAAEDAALRAAVREFGCDWKRVEIHVQGRSGQQCRERWVGRLANIPAGETQAVRRAWHPEVGRATHPGRCTAPRKRCARQDVGPGRAGGGRALRQDGARAMAAPPAS